MQGRQGGAVFAGRGFQDQVGAADAADLDGGQAQEFRALDDFVGVAGGAGDDDAALGFAEEQGVQAEVFEGGEVRLRADEAAETILWRRNPSREA